MNNNDKNIQPIFLVLKIDVKFIYTDIYEQMT